MERFALLVRALRWRRGLSLATLIVAAITIGASSLGPIYARAAGESTLRDRLNSSASDAALHFTFTRDISTEGDLEQTIGLGPTPGAIKAYPSVLTAIAMPTSGSTGQQVATGEVGPNTKLVWRQGSCAHFVLVEGRCADRAGEVVVSERTLQGDYYGWQIGTMLTLNNVTQDATDGMHTVPVTVRIVGAYRLRDALDPFWEGRSYFDAHPGSGDGDVSDTVDSIFVDRSELALLAKPSKLQVQVDYPIDPDRVRLADIGKLRSQVATLSAYRSGTDIGDSFTTNVLQVLSTAKSDERLINLSTLLVSLQLAALAWLVLFQVLADAVEAKGNEVALAKLRGLRPLATLRFGLAEPALLVAIATPLGLLGGWLSVRVIASSVLVPGTPVSLPNNAYLAVAAALCGCLVAAFAASQRTLRRSVLEQWRRTPGHRPSRLMLALDVVLAAAAIVGLLMLRRTTRDGHPQAVTLLAPALLVFAVALLGVRLLPLLLRPLLPATRATQRIGLFLAARQVVRRPAGLRLAALLAVAVGLATFAIAGEGIAQRNQLARARAEIGAPQVAPVQFEPLHDPVQATRTVDPKGEWAMATASWLPDGGISVTGTVLAVDSSRLAAVAYSGNMAASTSQLAGSLVPPFVPPPLTLRGTAIRLTAVASGLSPGSRPTVLFNVRLPGQSKQSIPAGSLATGRQVYTAAVPCSNGCTLTGFTWDRPIDTFNPMSGTVLLAGVEVQSAGRWAALPAGFDEPDSWHGNSQFGNATDRLTVTDTGLTDSYSDESGGSSGITHSDSPDPLLAVTSRNGVVTGPNAPHPLEMIDNTGAHASFSVVRSVPVLPSVLDEGLMVDLAAVRAQLPSFDTEATWSIWLGPKAPANAIDLLRKAGLVLQVGSTESGRAAQLGRQGPALALRLLVICAITGSILAVGGTAIAIASTGRRRSFELASLRALGIRRGALLRASTIEQLLLLGAALILGVPAGYFAARLSMPSIPEFADSTPVALHYRPALLGVSIFAVIFALLLLITALVAGHALMRAAAPSRLREAE